MARMLAALVGGTAVIGAAATINAAPASASSPVIGAEVAAVSSYGSAHGLREAVAVLDDERNN